MKHIIDSADLLKILQNVGYDGLSEYDCIEQGIDFASFEKGCDESHEIIGERLRALIANSSQADDRTLVDGDYELKLMLSNSPQADGMVLVPSEPNNVAYHEVVDALIGMVWQYLEDANGFIYHDFMSAGENAECVLERLGIVKEGKIIDKFKDDGEVKLHIEAMLSAYKPQSDDVRKDAWISVEDRLPAVGQKVWVGRNGEVPAVMECIFDGVDFVEPNQYGWKYAGKFVAPTHWQPEYKPAPPLDKARE